MAVRLLDLAHRAPEARRSPPAIEDEFAAIDQHVQVSFRYRVLFTERVFATDNPLLAETLAPRGSRTPARVLVVVEEGVARHTPDLIGSITAYAASYADDVCLVAEPLVVPGGEQVKNDPSVVARVQQAIDRGRICRHSYVVAVGGGALLDMVGYAAATAHRGVRLVRVPTTVLAQGDSGVGVKNGVNAFGKKNFLGTFAPPVAVINDSTFLTTLSDREWRSGIAEAIKVALLKDCDAFEEIERSAAALSRRDMPAMRRLVYRAAQLHLEHIATSGDPFECGSSRPLDMGHWAAHKLEALSNFRLLHGEAVAIGLALDATYAWQTGVLAEVTWRRIIGLLSAVGLPICTPELYEHLDDSDDPHNPLHGLAEFREHLGGELTIMLPRDIGRGVEVHAMDHAVIRRCIGLLRGYRRSE